MKRNTSAAGRSTRRRRTSTPKGAHVGHRRYADFIDPDAPELAGIDWDRLPRHTVELDPALIETIHAKRKLKQLTLRVGVEQIAEARRVAAKTGTKYQAVLRRWLAEGASRERARRRSPK